MIMGLVSVKIVTAALSKELVGPYFTAYEYLQFFGILADFGLYAIAVREVSKSRDKSETLSSLFTLRLLITVFSLAAAVTIAFLLPSWNGTVLPVGVGISAFVPFFTLLAGMERVVFQISYKMQYAALSEALSRITVVALMLAALYSGLRGAMNPIILYLFFAFGGVGSLVLFLTSILCSRRFVKRRFSFRFADARRYFRLAMPFGICFLFTALYRQLDLTLISLLRPADFPLQTALYGAAFRIVESGVLIPTFFLNSVLPTLTERLEVGQGSDLSRFVGKVLLAILCLASLFALFSFFWARPLLALLTNDSYLSTSSAPGSDTALRLLSLPLALNMLVTYCFYVLLSKHRWRPLIATLGLGAAISLASNFMLIPTYGFLGAASTSIGVHLLLTFLLLPVGLRTLRPSLPVSEFAKWVQFSLVLGVLLYLSEPFLTSWQTTLLGLAGGGVVVATLLLVTGLVKALVKD
jgi:O-antigen/teichoic acid export membrane protein